MSNEQNNVTANPEYKDRLFNFIFGSSRNRKWTLSLYNAVNGSDYTDENEIEINTIKEVLYLGMHNDTSFLISGMMNVYEHQSSFNPNMPLRQLQYLGSLYEGYVKRNRLNKFGNTLIMLPVPKLVVFYNGFKETDDEVVLKLSDSFEEDHRAESDVEVRVRMLNINYGHNHRLTDACRPLYEYSWLIDKVREKRKTMTIENALSQAIDEVPEDFVLKSFLMINKSEVSSMLLTEYNEAEVMELFKEDGRKEGREEGREEGRKEGRKEGREEGREEGADRHLIEQICKKLKNGKSIEIIADEVEEQVDAIRPICDAAGKYAPDYDVDTIFNELHQLK